MERDTLFLVKPGFSDPAYPGQSFFCWHCALIEGLLAGFPEFAARLDVRRVAWPRPRGEVIEMAGEANQWLPLLILAEGEASPHETGRHEGRALIADKDAILSALAERHGFPLPHP
ncbi:DUF3088 domain-containing protein [Aureimonas populi]|uniref:DUF3088 domain-containing protein n=1 Tax=Aureimonas populi TaxID=1701758 RepID=A0ABW5CQ76_9HYPH|nr:DUF3088 domain-containing protein [Aureimonas populi]